MKILKKIAIGIISISFIALPLLFASPKSVDAISRVRGYTTSRGTYVAPHYRSTPNRTKIDNWSTKGNYNPMTGKAGTKRLW